MIRTGHLSFPFTDKTIGAVIDSISGSNGLVYLVIPDAPTFGATTTINPTDTEITTPDLGGNTDIILGAGTHAPRIMFTSLVGTELAPIRFKGAGGTQNPSLTTIGDLSVANQGAIRGNASDWVEFYDMLIEGDHVFVWEQSSRNVLLQNVELVGDFANGFSGFRSKTDNNNSVVPYKIVLQYLNIKDVIGEGIYIGQVNGATYHNISEFTANHIYATNCGRESIQLSHVENVDINHFTGINSGTENELSQNRALQIQDCSGIIRNSFFHSVGTNGNAYAILENTDGMTYFNCYFESEEHVYLGNAEARDWYPNSTIKGNKKKIFDSCIFNFQTTNTQTQLLQVFLDICDVEVRNCVIIDTYDGLFADSRIDKITYDLIDGGGNIFVPAAHISMNPTWDSMGRVTTNYHYNRGMGTLVNDPVLATYSTVTITGTEQKGETLTAAVSGGNSGAGSSIAFTTYQWYRADDIAGLNKILIAGATSSTYLLVSADEGKFILCEATPSNDIPMTGVAIESAYTGAIAAAPFSPFADITWDIAARPSGAVDLATNEFWTNEGTGANLAREGAENIPSYASGLVDFTRANLDMLNMPGNSYTTDYEFWIEFTPDNTNFQVLFALSSSINFRMQSGGALRWGGTNLGYVVSTGVTYRIRIYLNGASSVVEIRDDANSVLLAETVVSLPSSNTGAGNGRMGAQTNNLNGYGGTIKYSFLKKGSEDANKANMWTWLNDN